MNSNRMVRMLTDAYKKDENSNNYKMFKMLNELIDEVDATQKNIRDYHDIDIAKGNTLDLFGVNLGLERKGLTDEIYRVMLKAKALRNQSTGSLNNTTELIAYALNTDVKNIELKEDFEDGGKSCYVTVNNLPFTILNNIGMSVAEYEAMLKSILPIGVELSTTNVEGTFAFATGDGSSLETDTGSGFADDEQTTGGTLGASVGSAI